MTKETTIELHDTELEAAQGGTRQGITLDVEPNDTIQNVRTRKPDTPPSTGSSILDSHNWPD